MARHLPKKRALAFIDFLGFRSKIEQMPRNVEIYELIKENLNEIKSDLVQRKSTQLSSPELGRFGGYYYPLEATQFSDSLVLSVEPKAAGVETLIEIVGSLSDRLLMKGLFIRGGIALGWAYHEENIVFGKAMNDAYDIESKKAIFPRVVIDDLIFKKIPDWCKEMNISRDNDGLLYIKPFTNLIEIKGNVIAIPDCQQLADARIQIKKSLSSAKNNPKVYAKYHWLGTKFDEHIAECRQVWRFSASDVEMIFAHESTGRNRTRKKRVPPSPITS
ncbi:hypothetical protein [Bosea sp. 685]|uniref:hypothetical protein n=1 Tax=Bosea sp. 685 TaxID=3080057 RepID=UPI0028937EDF|nr:hypothetical protein [Bosea sp. 685]WNJ93027.1 hypothetical protein RMR04_12355 [Bosea sp. 685]